MCIRHKCARGMTLIELIIFMVIVGIAAVSVLQMLSVASRNSVDPGRSKQALLLAEALLEEVQGAPFTFCDPTDARASQATSATTNPGGCSSIVEAVGQVAPEPVLARPFNNVNDYVTQYGVNATPFNNASGDIVDIDGNSIAVSGFSATLQISQAAFNGVAAADSLRIVVTVSDTTGHTPPVVAEAYRLRYSPQI